jgi:dienelactone hydrolase
MRAVTPPRPARRQPSPAPRCPPAVGQRPHPHRPPLPARPAVHGPGPYPVVRFLQGSGGFWSNDTIPNPITPTNALASQFRDWGNLLVSLGYAALFRDGYNARGIPGNFEGRVPHHDPAQNDDFCSPNYERPKDVVASLEYLATRPNIDLQRLALIAFSQGA